MFPNKKKISLIWKQNVSIQKDSLQLKFCLIGKAIGIKIQKRIFIYPPNESQKSGRPNLQFYEKSTNYLHKNFPYFGPTIPFTTPYSCPDENQCTAKMYTKYVFRRKILIILLIHHFIIIFNKKVVKTENYHKKL